MFADLLIVGYVFLVICVTVGATEKEINTLTAFLTCILFSPFIGAFFVLNSKDKKTAAFEKRVETHLLEEKQDVEKVKVT